MSLFFKEINKKNLLLIIFPPAVYLTAHIISATGNIITSLNPTQSFTYLTVLVPISLQLHTFEP